MNNLEKIKQEIYKALPRLMEIQNGQRFESRFYGVIIATKIEKIKSIYSIYGFDVEKGLPRSEYYPRDLTILGIEPQLNDVLEWLGKIMLINGYENTDPYYINILGEIHNSKSQLLCKWDLSKPFLKDQSEELINYLASLT